MTLQEKFYTAPKQDTHYLKFLNWMGQGPYSGCSWPLPEGDTPGDWTPMVLPLSACASGWHFTDTEGCSYWLEERPFVIEPDWQKGYIIDQQHDANGVIAPKLYVCTRARLLRELPFGKDEQARFLVFALKSFWRTCLHYQLFTAVKDWREFKQAFERVLGLLEKNNGQKEYTDAQQLSIACSDRNACEMKAYDLEHYNPTERGLWHVLRYVNEAIVSWRDQKHFFGSCWLNTTIEQLKSYFYLGRYGIEPREASAFSDKVCQEFHTELSRFLTQMWFPDESLPGNLT
jgi:hypothetical protein